MITVTILSLFVFMACGSANTLKTQQEISKLDSLIQTKQFTITSDRATPRMTLAMQQVLNSGLLPAGSGAVSISLIGNYNYVTICGDSIKSYLPYFGERQMNVDYGGGDSAVKFEGLLKDYTVKKNKDHSYHITFKAKSNHESFDVYLQVFSNLKTEMSINGNSRTTIDYSGTISGEEEKGKEE